MPDAVEFDDIVETRPTDAFCMELAEQIAKGKAATFFLHDSHALHRRTPYRNQLVIHKTCTNIY